MELTASTTPSSAQPVGPVPGASRILVLTVLLKGFDTSYRPRIPISAPLPISRSLFPANRFSIVGRNGTNVQDEWADIPSHYLSMAIGPDFPNYVRHSLHSRLI